MDKKLQKVRKRLFEEFPFYAKSALRIRTKAGDVAPLKLNQAQQILDKAVQQQIQTDGKVRVIILKARQQGLSTYVGGYLYYAVSQQKARKAMVITHHADSTRALFDMTKRYHEHCPDILKPHTKYSSRRELSFDILDSSYVVATAGVTLLDEVKHLRMFMLRSLPSGLKALLRTYGMVSHRLFRMLLEPLYSSRVPRTV